MGTRNDRTFGVAAQDLRRMQGRGGAGAIGADMTARRALAKVQRALAYQTQIPRGIVVMAGDAYHDVAFDSKGWVWLHSSDGSIDVARAPQARVHAIDLTVNIADLEAGLIAAVYADPAFCAQVCACDCGTPGDPEPG